MVRQVAAEESSEERDVCPSWRYKFYQLLPRSRGLSGMRKNEQVSEKKSVPSAGEYDG